MGRSNLSCNKLETHGVGEGSVRPSAAENLGQITAIAVRACSMLASAYLELISPATLPLDAAISRHKASRPPHLSTGADAKVISVCFLPAVTLVRRHFSPPAKRPHPVLRHDGRPA